MKQVHYNVVGKKFGESWRLLVRFDKGPNKRDRARKFVNSHRKSYVRNFGVGGLCFVTDEDLPKFGLTVPTHETKPGQSVAVLPAPQQGRAVR